MTEAATSGLQHHEPPSLYEMMIRVNSAHINTHLRRIHTLTELKQTRRDKWQLVADDLSDEPTGATCGR